MEQTYKRTVSSRQADRLKDYQLNCIANSNALYSISGTFAELSADAKRLLGLSNKKPLVANTAKGFKTKILTKDNYNND